MKKTILVITFVSLLTYGNEIIKNTDYSKIESTSSKKEHNKISNLSSSSCVKCHTCSANENYVFESDTLVLPNYFFEVDSLKTTTNAKSIKL